MDFKIESWLKRNLKGDPVIWTIVGLLSILSLLVVYSAVSAPAYKRYGGNTEVFLVKHLMLLFLSLAAMWVAHNINYLYYARISRILLILSVPLLLYTYFKGINVNQANRWIMIPIINQTFQTSDLAKLALISNLASMLAKRQDHIEDIKKTFVPIIMWCTMICGLIAMSNFSTAALLFATCILVMFIGRVPMKYLLTIFVSGALLILPFIVLGSRAATVVSRVSDWWAIVTGQMDPSQIPFQIEQSNIALARGGFWGVGIGQSQQRYFLPEAFSDYIFAIINEEYGLKISIIVVLLYMVLLYRGMIIASRSDKAFGGLLSVGLSFMLVMQALANMAVVVGLGPVTGLPLPLLSMGGTSLVFTGFTIGIILSVSRGDNKEPERSANSLSNQVEE